MADIVMELSSDDFKGARIVKPGWYPVLLKEFSEELNSKKDAMNVVVDTIIADPESEFFDTPVKHWFSEKAVRMPGGAVSFYKAFNPKHDDNKSARATYLDKAGQCIYAKIKTDRGADGSAPPRNVIEDWAPLPAKYKGLAEKATQGATAEVGSFQNT